jgi:hypothetical protein
MKQRMQTARRLSSLLAVLATLSLSAPAQATVMRYLSLEEHIEFSDVVVRAKVGASRTFVGERNLPFTDTSLEVLEVLQGTLPPGELRVRQMRGEVNGIFTSVPGDANLFQDEEVILFLGADESEPGVAYLTALGQSKYKISLPPGAGPGGGGQPPVPVVLRDLSDATFYVPGPDASMTHGIEEAPIPLDLFRSTVRDLAQGKQ